MPAHPRSRGENVSGAIGQKPPLGSSPLTRGKLPSFWPIALADGLIPAHAGKTHDRPRRGRRHRAHPRSRGENAELGFTKVGGSGSSPLTRGKRVACPQHPPRHGLIPAHAGKTSTVGDITEDG